MVDCDDCGTAVRQVWRHRAFETEARRVTRWVCPDCHPDVPSELTMELEPDHGPSPEAETSTRTPLRPDGGRAGGVATAAGGATDTTGPSTATESRFPCPVCGGATVNGQGMQDCLDCTWSGTR